MHTSASPDKAALHKALSILKTQAALATACGFTHRRNVWPWFNTERPVPADKCPAIERATDGAVRCEQLRPDVAWIRVPDKGWRWHRRGRPVLDVTKGA